MKRAIDKYRGQSKDGYIFPIMDDKKEKMYKTKEYLQELRGKAEQLAETCRKSLEFKLQFVRIRLQAYSNNGSHRQRTPSVIYIKCCRNQRGNDSAALL